MGDFYTENQSEKQTKKALIPLINSHQTWLERENASENTDYSQVCKAAWQKNSPVSGLGRKSPYILNQ